jgi:ferritin-like metal-binding protein YciE
MEENAKNPSKDDKINFGHEKLKIFFVTHLDKIYAAKSHLIKHLPLLVDHIYFTDLQSAIRETMDNVEKQIARMEIIYSILDSEIGTGNFTGLAGLINDAFADIDIYSSDPEFRDLSIAFYMQNIESMEAASFQILQMAAVKLKNKQIQQLISDNYREAKSDRTLLLLITAKYMIAK